MSLFRAEVLQHGGRRLHGEIVLAQPLSVRAIALGLGGVAAAAGSWLALGSFARTESAPGLLQTTLASAKVVAPSGGIVTRLAVAEGTAVAPGDLLAVVTADRGATGGGTVGGAALAALDRRLALGEAQIGTAAARQGAERRQAQAALAAAQADARQLAEQAALQTELVASSQRLFDQIESVVEKGFVSRIEYERRRQALLTAEQALGALEQQRGAAASRAEEARAQLAVLASEGAAQVGELRSGQLQLAQQQAQLRGEQAFEVRAPIAGRVTALQTAAGRAAAPGVPLLTIVPDGSALKAEIYAPSRAIGFVRPGQECRLLFDAFPYQRFGSFGGRVASVSRTVIDPRDTDVPLKLEGPVYRVTVTLERQQVDAYGEAIAQQPGMTLTANIVLERQSFIGWLLRPLHAVMRRT